MKNVLITILLVVLALAVLCGLAIGFGWFDVFMTNTVGVAQQDAEYHKFKNSEPYVEGMIQDLADMKLELSREEDPIARQAIVETIVTRFANFDVRDIDDADLRDFLRDCRNGDID